MRTHHRCSERATFFNLFQSRLGLCMLSGAFVLATLLSPPTPAGEKSWRAVPLPVEVATATRAGSGYDLSPDGQWVAYHYSEGTRTRVRLEHVATGRVVEPAAPGSSSVRPKWSPDSRKVAFYSDESGEPLLWVWERDTGRKHSVAGAGIDLESGVVRWFADSARLLTVLWPQGIPRPGSDAATKAQRITQATVQDSRCGRGFCIYPAGECSCAVRKPEAGAAGKRAASEDAGAGRGVRHQGVCQHSRSLRSRDRERCGRHPEASRSPRTHRVVLRAVSRWTLRCLQRVQGS